MTRAGQKITLECDIAGKPRPEIYVMHNGKQLSDHDVKVSIQNALFNLSHSLSTLTLAEYVINFRARRIWGINLSLWCRQFTILSSGMYEN